MTMNDPADMARGNKLPAVRVLLVEDNVLVALDTEETLLDAGAVDVVTARSATEALKLMVGRHFDAAVLDIPLADDRRFDLAHALRVATVPFVFATGYCEADLLPSPFHTIPIVIKPYRPSDLIGALLR